MKKIISFLIILILCVNLIVPSFTYADSAPEEISTETSPESTETSETDTSSIPETDTSDVPETNTSSIPETEEDEVIDTEENSQETTENSIDKADFVSKDDFSAADVQGEASLNKRNAKNMLSDLSNVDDPDDIADNIFPKKGIFLKSVSNEPKHYVDVK